MKLVSKGFDSLFKKGGCPEKATRSSLELSCLSYTFV